MGHALRRFASVAVAAAAILFASSTTSQVAVAGDNTLTATFEIAPTGDGQTGVSLDIGTNGPVSGLNFSVGGPQCLLVGGMGYRANGTQVISVFLLWPPLHEAVKFLDNVPQSGVEGPITIFLKNPTDSPRKLRVTARWE